MKLIFEHNLTFKRCTKCGKGHDLSAINCSKQKGKDEKRDRNECFGKLEMIQFNEIEVQEYKTVKNK